MSRFQRQQDLVPLDKLQSLTITVIGVGAIGRQVALQLAAIGASHIQLIDFDRVEPTNITTQGYLQRDLGQLKVAATAAQIHEIDPTITVTPIADRWRPEHPTGEAVFCCVDTISARTAIWRSLQHCCQFWCDGRMRGDTVRVLTAHDVTSRDHYAGQLFPQSEAQSGGCTAKSTFYCASIAAGLMANQLIHWIRDFNCHPDTTLSLLAVELVALNDDNILLGDATNRETCCNNGRRLVQCRT